MSNTLLPPEIAAIARVQSDLLEQLLLLEPSPQGDTHNRQYLEAVTRAGANSDASRDDVRAFVKHFTAKDPVFSREPAGLAAIRFEAFLIKEAGDLFKRLIETVAERNKPDFLAVFTGKVFPEELERLREGVEKFAKLKVLVEAGRMSKTEHRRADVTIIQGLPAKGKPSDVTSNTPAAAQPAKPSMAGVPAGGGIMPAESMVEGADYLKMTLKHLNTADNKVLRNNHRGAANALDRAHTAAMLHLGQEAGWEHPLVAAISKAKDNPTRGGINDAMEQAEKLRKANAESLHGPALEAMRDYVPETAEDEELRGHLKQAVADYMAGRVRWQNPSRDLQKLGHFRITTDAEQKKTQKAPWSDALLQQGYNARSLHKLAMHGPALEAMREDVQQAYIEQLAEAFGGAFDYVQGTAHPHLFRNDPRNGDMLVIALTERHTKRGTKVRAICYENGRPTYINSTLVNDLSDPMETLPPERLAELVTSRGLPYLTSPANITSRYGTWRVEKDPSNDRAVRIVTGEERKPFSLAKPLHEVRQFIHNIATGYGPLIEEFDLATEACLSKYAGEHSTVLLEDAPFSSSTSLRKLRDKQIDRRNGIRLAELHHYHYHNHGCHVAGTLIRMADGTVKRVEEVEQGDKLMGPDAKPRTVLELKRGRDEMYRILSSSRESFDVNQHHVLSLACLNAGMENIDPVTPVVCMTVREYMSLPDREKFTLRRTLDSEEDRTHCVPEGGYAFSTGPFTVRTEAACSLIVAVTALGEDDYYGFALTGDRLYCTADGIVHHNSGHMPAGQFAKTFMRTHSPLKRKRLLTRMAARVKERTGEDVYVSADPDLTEQLNRHGTLDRRVVSLEEAALLTRDSSDVTSQADGEEESDVPRDNGDVTSCEELRNKLSVTPPCYKFVRPYEAAYGSVVKLLGRVVGMTTECEKRPDGRYNVTVQPCDEEGDRILRTATTAGVEESEEDEIQMYRDNIAMKRSKGEQVPQAWIDGLAKRMNKGEPAKGTVHSMEVFGHPMATNLHPDKYAHLIPIKVEKPEHLAVFHKMANKAYDELNQKIGRHEAISQKKMKGNVKISKAYLASMEHTEDSTIRDLIKSETLPELARLDKVLKAEAAKTEASDVTSTRLTEDAAGPPAVSITEAVATLRKGDADAEPLSRQYDRWIRQGDNYKPSGPIKIENELGRFAYRCAVDMMGTPVLVRVRPQTDELYKFDDSTMTQVLEEIDRFWSLEPDYSRLGILHNRGILMHGPPGSGKTSIVHQVSEMVVSRGDCCLYARDIGALTECLKAIRQVEPDRKCLVILEDADEFIRHSEREFLQLLDGEQAFSGVLYLATSNYIDRFPPRLLRPGRFDEHVYVGMPPRAGRLAYLSAKLAKIDEAGEDTLNDLADRTSGMSFGHLRELITAVYALKQPLEGVLERLRKTAPDPLESDSHLGDQEAKAVRYPSMAKLRRSGYGMSESVIDALLPVQELPPSATALYWEQRVNESLTPRELLDKMHARRGTKECPECKGTMHFRPCPPNTRGTNSWVCECGNALLARGVDESDVTSLAKGKHWRLPKTDWNDPDVQQARDLGKRAWAAGKHSAPALDADFGAFLKAHMAAGKSPLPVLDGWTRGYHEANAAAPAEAKRAAQCVHEDYARTIGQYLPRALSGELNEASLQIMTDSPDIAAAIMILTRAIKQGTVFGGVDTDEPQDENLTEEAKSGVYFRTIEDHAVPFKGKDPDPEESEKWKRARSKHIEETQRQRKSKTLRVTTDEGSHTIDVNYGQVHHRDPTGHVTRLDPDGSTPEQQAAAKAAEIEHDAHRKGHKTVHTETAVAVDEETAEAAKKGELTIPMVSDAEGPDKALVAAYKWHAAKLGYQLGEFSKNPANGNATAKLTKIAKPKESITEAVAPKHPDEPKDGPTLDANGSYNHPEFRIGKARYAKGMYALQTKSDGPYKARAGRLADAVSGGRYTHREGAYVVSKAQANRFLRLHHHGWEASSWDSTLRPPDEGDLRTQAQQKAEQEKTHA